MEEIDASSGLIIPFYDPDTEMVYLAGKVRHWKSIAEELEEEFLIIKKLKIGRLHAIWWWECFLKINSRGSRGRALDCW